jgi:hypothetical protein
MTTIISGNSGTINPAGTAAAPSIVGGTSSNTGIYFPSATVVAFSAGGSTALTIDSTGNVTVQGLLLANSIVTTGATNYPSGVNITSANTSINSSTGALVVTGGAGIGGNINAGGSQNTFSGKVGIGTSSSLGTTSNAFTVYGASQLYGNIVLANLAAGTSGIYFPDGTLQTTAAAAPSSNIASGTAGAVQFSGGSGVFTSDANNLFWDNTNKRIGIGTNAPISTLDVNGSLGVRGSASTAGVLSAAGINSNSYVIAGNVSVTGVLLPNTGIYAPGTNQLGFATAGTLKMFIDSTGNVGLGTGTAPYPLSVNGQINANNLQSDPAGVIQSYAQTISSPYTIPASRNAMSVGNVNIATGANVTVPNGSRWVVL